MFEYDPAKTASNKTKHGIDFVEAQALWTGETVAIAAKTVGEKRWAVLGMIGTQYWPAITTQRGKNTRLISVRRSTPGEIKLYEETKKTDR